jgi:hypothetical protein
MRKVAIAVSVAVLGGAAATPAAADTVPLDQALQAVSQACSASATALAGGGSIVRSSSTVTLAPGRFGVAGATANRVVVADTGTFGPIADDRLRARDRRAALRYLKRPKATWWLNSGRFESPAQGWAATFDQSRAAAVALDGSCTQSLDGAFDEVQRDGSTWTFTAPAQGPVVVVIDAEGRLLSWDETQVSYAAQTVTPPTGAVAFAAWQKASQAASLNQTLRSLTRQVAAEVNADEPTLAAIDAFTRAVLPTQRAVPLKVRQLRNGVLVFGRNPYTKTYHAWRVYLRSGKAVARKVAP